MGNPRRTEGQSLEMDVFKILSVILCLFFFFTHFYFLQILCLKLVREQIEKAIVNGTQPNALLNSHAQVPSASPSVVEATPVVDNSSLIGQGEPSSPVSVAPVVTTPSSNLHSETTPVSSASPAVAPLTGTNADEVEAPANTSAPLDANVGSDEASVADVNTARTPTYHLFFSVLDFFTFFYCCYFNSFLFLVNIVGMMLTSFHLKMF